MPKSISPTMRDFNSTTLDSQVIESLRELGGDDDPGLVGELIELFLEDAPKHLQSMVSSLESGDLEVMTRAAHTLKSSSANIGGLHLGDVCAAMENAARQEDLVGFRELISVCQNAFAELTESLRHVA